MPLDWGEDELDKDDEKEWIDDWDDGDQDSDFCNQLRKELEQNRK